MSLADVDTTPGPQRKRDHPDVQSTRERLHSVAYAWNWLSSLVPWWLGNLRSLGCDTTVLTDRVSVLRVPCFQTAARLDGYLRHKDMLAEVCKQFDCESAEYTGECRSDG